MKLIYRAKVLEELVELFRILHCQNGAVKVKKLLHLNIGKGSSEFNLVLVFVLYHDILPDGIVNEIKKRSGIPHVKGNENCSNKDNNQNTRQASGEEKIGLSLS
jgi:hypothetical protein